MLYCNCSCTCIWKYLIRDIIIAVTVNFIWFFLSLKRKNVCLNEKHIVLLYGWYIWVKNKIRVCIFVSILYIFLIDFIRISYWFFIIFVLQFYRKRFFSKKKAPKTMPPKTMSNPCRRIFAQRHISKSLL